MRTAILNTVSLTGMFAMGACGPIAYNYSAEEKSSRPSALATDLESLVTFGFYDTRLSALNAARRFCGLPEVSSNDKLTAEAEMNAQYGAIDALNRELSFECPASEEDTQ